MRSCAVLFKFNINYILTFIISQNLDYRQRNLGERNLYSILLFLWSGAEEKN